MGCGPITAHQRGLGPDDLLDPLLVAVVELLDAHAAVTARVEDVEHVSDPLRVNSEHYTSRDLNLYLYIYKS